MIILKNGRVPTADREVAGSNLGRGYFVPIGLLSLASLQGRQPAAAAGKATAGTAHSACR